MLGLELLEPWHFVTEERRGQLEAELLRELPEGHLLSSKPRTALAARSDQDDVLFEVAGLGYAVVHLTWSGGRERSREWPHTTLFATLDEWRERVMQPVHAEWSNAANLRG